MGIVNLTDNSYFASSRCLGSDGTPDLERTMERVAAMVQEGADIIDIGACSTRPGSDPVGEAEEWKRLEPVLRAVWGRFPGVDVSIDTYWASVAQRAWELQQDVAAGTGEAAEGGRRAAAADDATEVPQAVGQLIINDISAGEDDPQMLPTVARLELPYIAMHKRGTPKTMQSLCDYGDVTEEVLQYFRDFGARADSLGIKDWVLDPGFGFAKTIEQNYQLLRDLHRFSELGRPILVGVSRKSMIYRKFGITPEEALPQTQVLHYAALERGASILRVHDVAEAVRTVRNFAALH